MQNVESLSDKMCKWSLIGIKGLNVQPFTQGTVAVLIKGYQLESAKPGKAVGNAIFTYEKI